jgi:hypothetical protein
MMTPITSTEQCLLDMNTKLRARIAALEHRAETDENSDEPKPEDKKDYLDTTEDSVEIDPKTGKVKKKKAKVVEPDDESQDEVLDDNEPPAPFPSPRPTDAKAFALAICNSGRKARGLKPLTCLAQDEQIVSDRTVPTTAEAFARSVIDCGRKARGQAPLEPNEFVTLRELRGR